MHSVPNHCESDSDRCGYPHNSLPATLLDFPLETQMPRVSYKNTHGVLSVNEAALIASIAPNTLRLACRNEEIKFWRLPSSRKTEYKINAPDLFHFCKAKDIPVTATLLRLMKVYREMHPNEEDTKTRTGTIRPIQNPDA